ADHRDTLKTQRDLAREYQNTGRFREARKLFEDLLALRRARLGPADPYTLTALRDLALLHDAAGDHGLAEPLWKERVAGRRQPDPESGYLADALYELGLHLLRQRKHAEAEPAARESLALRRLTRKHAEAGPAARESPALSWNVASAHWVLGAALAGQRK